MAAEELESAVLGWRGIEGDRRFAFHIAGSNESFPWLNAGKHKDLIGYKPYRVDSLLPNYVISPAGKLSGCIPVPEDLITNLAFGGQNKKTLYVTAGKSLFKIQTKVAGWSVFPK